MSQIYDTIVIGAGISGCCTAFTLQQKGQKVLLVDRSGVAASGGSGAAGAFVSPKIGKGSPLQKLTNEAFYFSKDFYLKHFPDYFHQTGVIRIPKDTEDAEKFHLYEPFNEAQYRWVAKEELEKLGIRNCKESFFFEEAGVCDAPELCNAILQQLPFKQFDVAQLIDTDGHWTLFNAQGSTLNAKNVVLSTGYQNTLFDMRYMGVRGTWGSRGDYESKLDLKVSMHKSISVSANINGIIKIGATHVKSREPCRLCDGKPLRTLEEKAARMVNTGDFRLKETFCGMRSGSKDYVPLAGRVIDVPFMFEAYPSIVRGAKPPLKHRENLYVCNGLGGRGFVFAPLMAEWLAESIVTGKEMDQRVNPDRLFLKWCRKL
ncbi:FAD-dependent 5-carboxymethylaminomethyl-2-thiouridine(34) oxidoreductase MnmC [Sulfurovum sp. NBC37-1]|uniref:FAD-dependent 5-carboxymethylaminomethyl-2-thiouridine(34) oxidoreductase MnmC n=1 Tax=Sulfurovum sp. (strain NBC37-1) TaxID=387093 RepID=UPI0001587DB0|nr:FAD-dependent 5-carboxymethylaminomethyl-2-thiouridine(34) oxidoreductase MnmC [Sulfurovum sp. NBC37-1]BAF72650.1 FAD dependent oxidoreductase [Sulfurovum sp. NBC37-1]